MDMLFSNPMLLTNDDAVHRAGPGNSNTARTTIDPRASFSINRHNRRSIGTRSGSATSVSSNGIRLPTVPEASEIVMPVHSTICYDDYEDDSIVDESDIRMMVRRCMVRACIQATTSAK
ncbi:hypothetical protein FOL47_006120 [Perkinsus chesapeaki]|uniref:Uncharacterized protein n=1 Tax=Perkinsus chesapeaki TaxID=330153 RepID=A0A7J6MXX2_PERCH|nr:hypothetical protein FOL47_006120 [Perkinsus chesapeaki]